MLKETTMQMWNKDSRGNARPTKAFMMTMLLRWARHGPPPWKQWAKLQA